MLTFSHLNEKIILLVLQHVFVLSINVFDQLLLLKNSIDIELNNHLHIHFMYWCYKNLDYHKIIKKKHNLQHLKRQ
jgi:hypothetical protein